MCRLRLREAVPVHRKGRLPRGRPGDEAMISMGRQIPAVRRSRRPRARPGLVPIDAGCVNLPLLYTLEVAVRTKIVIDDRLMAEALRATGLRTKREVVEAGLRLRARQEAAAELFGAIGWRGDLDAERRDEPARRPDRRAAIRG